MQKQPNGRGTAAEKARNAFLHRLPCIVTGRDDVQVAHVRAAQAAFNKRLAGMGRKPHWVWTVPLSVAEHAEQGRDEFSYWRDKGFDWFGPTASVLAACLILEGFRAMDDVEGATRWMEWRRNA